MIKVDFINISLITLTLISSSPSLSNDYGEAADQARRAILETETAKKTVKSFERRATNLLEEELGMEKGDLIYFAWAVPVVSGRISTKPFRNMKWDLKYGTIRPEIEYRFTGETNAIMQYTYEF